MSPTLGPGQWLGLRRLGGLTKQMKKISSFLLFFIVEYMQRIVLRHMLFLKTNWIRRKTSLSWKTKLGFTIGKTKPCFSMNLEKLGFLNLAEWTVIQPIFKLNYRATTARWISQNSEFIASWWLSIYLKIDRWLMKFVVFRFTMIHENFVRSIIIKSWDNNRYKKIIIKSWG